jgi:hypothetical protein
MNAEGIREAQYERTKYSSFFILHSSLNFAKQNSFGRAASPRRAFGTCLLASGYPLHHAPRFALARGSAAIPLA